MFLHIVSEGGVIRAAEIFACNCFLELTGDPDIKITYQVQAGVGLTFGLMCLKYCSNSECQKP